MRKWTYCLTSALITGLPHKYPFLLALWTSDMHLWLWLTYSGRQTSKQCEHLQSWIEGTGNSVVWINTRTGTDVPWSAYLRRQRSCRMALETDGKGTEAQGKLLEIGTVYMRERTWEKWKMHWRNKHNSSSTRARREPVTATNMDLMKENTFLLRKISCITSLWNSFPRAGKVLRRTEKNCLEVLHVCSRNHSQFRRKKLYLKEQSYKPLLFRELDWWGSTGNWKVTVQPSSF